MISLEKPQYNVEDVFRDCISNCKDSSLKQKYENVVSDILANTQLYEECFSKRQVHTIVEHTVLGEVTKEEMVKVYDNKMVKKGQPGRKYYDDILSIPRFGICPYCGVREVSTLDHFLPKSKYISYVVTPSNLIPVCFECNHTKLDQTFQSEEDVLINPYFDRFGNDIWLKADLIQGSEKDLLMNYRVIKPDSWDEQLYIRVCKQFEVLKLNKLYSIHAAQKLNRLKIKVLSLLPRGDQAVIDDLNMSISCFENVNDWEASMYRELLDNYAKLKEILLEDSLQTV